MQTYCTRQTLLSSTKLTSLPVRQGLTLVHSTKRDSELTRSFDASSLISPPQPQIPSPKLWPHEDSQAWLNGTALWQASGRRDNTARPCLLPPVPRKESAFPKWVRNKLTPIRLNATCGRQKKQAQSWDEPTSTAQNPCYPFVAQDHPKTNKTMTDKISAADLQPKHSGATPLQNIVCYSKTANRTFWRLGRE